MLVILVTVLLFSVNILAQNGETGAQGNGGNGDANGGGETDKDNKTVGDETNGPKPETVDPFEEPLVTTDETNEPDKGEKKEEAMGEDNKTEGGNKTEEGEPDQSKKTDEGEINEKTDKGKEPGEDCQDISCDSECKAKYIANEKLKGVAGHCSQESCICTHVVPCEEAKCTALCKEKHENEKNLTSGCHDDICKCVWAALCTTDVCEKLCLDKYPNSAILTQECSGYYCICKYSIAQKQTIGKGNARVELERKAFFVG